MNEAKVGTFDRNKGKTPIDFKVDYQEGHSKLGGTPVRGNTILGKS